MIINLTRRNKLWWNQHQNAMVFIRKNKMSSPRCRPFCLDLNVLTITKSQPIFMKLHIGRINITDLQKRNTLGLSWLTFPQVVHNSCWSDQTRHILDCFSFFISAFFKMALSLSKLSIAVLTYTVTVLRFLKWCLNVFLEANIGKRNCASSVPYQFCRIV